MQSPDRDRLIRFFYTLLLMAICVAGVYYVAVYVPAVRDTGSPWPVGAQVVPQERRGETVYITARQEFQQDLYGAAFAVALLTWLAAGITLEMKFKVRIFRQPPRRVSRGAEADKPKAATNHR